VLCILSCVLKRRFALFLVYITLLIKKKKKKVLSFYELSHS
jgi:hypothetical protein